MPDIKSVIRKMIEDGESEDVIDAVVKKLQSGSEIKSGLPDMSPELAPKDEYKGPDTWMGGFKNSLLNKVPGSQFSEAMQAGGKGLKGFAKGAIADIPSTIFNTGKDILDMHLNPGQTSLRMFNDIKQVPDIVKNAGNQPEIFGRFLGNVTGQPLMMETGGLAAIRGIPRLRAPVSKTLAKVGGVMEKAQPTAAGMPVTPRMIGLRTAARGVSAAGKGMQRTAEKMRMKASGVETANQAAARTRPNPPPNEKVYAGGGGGYTRPRPVRHEPRGVEVDPNTEFTRPILETAEELAARNRPSVFTGGQSSRNRPTPFEPRPLDTTPYEPPPVRPEGLPPEPLPIDPFAAPASKIPLKGGRLKPNRRNQSPPYEPAIDPFAPPSTDLTIPVGEGGLSSRYRHDPFEFGQDPIGELGLPPTPKTKTKAAPPPPEPTFEPAIDPAANFSPEDMALMQSRRAEMKAALEKMASGESVDPTTGEITTPPRTKGPWRQSEPNEEMGFFGNEDPPSIANDEGRQFANEIERTFPGDEAYDLGEISPGFRNTQSMPDWGSPEIPQRTILPEEWGDWGPDADIPTLVPDASGSHVAAPRVLDPPDLTSPIKQLTNEQLDRLSKLSPAEGGTGERGNAAQIELMRRGVGNGAPHVNDPTFYNARNGEVTNHNFRQGTSNTTRLEPGPVNPLRPEVPPGQVTNRSMFQLSEQRAAEGLPNPGREFADSIAPSEFSEDMMFTPNEMEPSAVPPQEISPFENQFDPRISNLGPADDILEGASPEFTTRRNPEAADDVSRETARRQQYEADSAANKRIRDEGKAREEIAFDENEIKLYEEGIASGDDPTLVADAISRRQARIAKNKGFLEGTANDEGRGKLVKKGGREKNFPSVIPENFEKVGKGRQVGPKGASYRIKGPDGKHLGDINVTPKDIAQVKAMEQYAHASNEDIATALYEGKLETMLTEHGYDIHEPKITSEPKTTRTSDIPLTPRDKPMPTTATGPIPEVELPSYGDMYKIATEEGVEFPNDTLATSTRSPQLEIRRGGEPSDYGEFGAESIDFSGTSRAPAFPNAKPKPSAFKTSTKVALDPDKDFGPGGDIKPILQEVRRLNSDGAADSRYRKLLPEIMRNELGPGETWKGKLDKLIETIQEELGPEEGAHRLAERELENDITRGYRRSGAEYHTANPPPLLTQKVMNETEFKPSKLNKERKPWVSPRFVQQHPDLARKLKRQYDQNK